MWGEYYEGWGGECEFFVLTSEGGMGVREVWGRGGWNGEEGADGGFGGLEGIGDGSRLKRML